MRKNKFYLGKRHLNHDYGKVIGGWKWVVPSMLRGFFRTQRNRVQWLKTVHPSTSSEIVEAVKDDLARGRFDAESRNRMYKEFVNRGGAGGLCI